MWITAADKFVSNYDCLLNGSRRQYLILNENTISLILYTLKRIAGEETM